VSRGSHGARRGRQWGSRGRDLAVALLSDDGGVAARVVEKAGASPSTLAQRPQQALGRMPRVSGGGASGG